MIAIGVGCRRGAAAGDVVALVREALDLLPDADTVTARGLFTHADKRDERGLHEAAATLGLPLTFLDADAMASAADGARSHSQRVEDLFGLPGIAETAALAGAGAGAVLLVPRLASATVTCAVAAPGDGTSSPVQRGRGTAEGSGGGGRTVDAGWDGATPKQGWRRAWRLRQPPPPRFARSPSPAARGRMCP